MSCENQCFGVPGFEVLRTITAEVWVLFVLYREMHFSIHRRGQIKGRDPWLVVSWNILEDNTPNSSQKLGLGAATPGQTSDPHPWHCQELSGLGQIRSDSHATGDSGPSCRPWQWPNTSFVLLDMWVGWLRSVLSWPHRVVACWAWLAWTGPMKRRDCSWLSHFSSHRCSLFPFCTLLFFFLSLSPCSWNVHQSFLQSAQLQQGGPWTPEDPGVIFERDSLNIQSCRVISKVVSVAFPYLPVRTQEVAAEWVCNSTLFCQGHPDDLGLNLWQDEVCVKIFPLCERQPNVPV